MAEIDFNFVLCTISHKALNYINFFEIPTIQQRVVYYTVKRNVQAFTEKQFIFHTYVIN